MTLLFENLPTTQPRNVDLKKGASLIDPRLHPDQAQQALAQTFIGQASVAISKINTCRECHYWARSLTKSHYKYHGYVKNNGDLRRGYCFFPNPHKVRLIPHFAKACSQFDLEDNIPPIKNPSTIGRDA